MKNCYFSKILLICSMLNNRGGTVLNFLFNLNTQLTSDSGGKCSQVYYYYVICLLCQLHQLRLNLWLGK